LSLTTGQKINIAWRIVLWQMDCNMTVRVKICGITSLKDGMAAVDAGAHALGFVFYEHSPRQVTCEIAQQITRALPPFVTRVGVFVNPSEDLVRRMIDACGIDALQFHGEEPPEFCEQFGMCTIKAFRIRDRGSIRQLDRYQTDAWLLDSYVPGQPGGTGAQFNWDLAREARELGRPIILAGGLTPENVGEAIRRAHPFAVDVSSGVETEPGRKDLKKIEEFIRRAAGVSS
jgi:phosphoribosylanthranilate isomerase